MTAETVTPLKTLSHYDLLDKIAEGGMGTVYRGRDNDTGQIVAIKVVPKHLLSNQVFLKRFEQEYTAARALDHPNVVRALDFGHVGDTPFLVMEFVDGESLGARLEREGALPESEAIRIIGQAAQGLHKAHKLGLIHRDVKPDNILITLDGQAKVTDLGLVKELEADQNLTRTGRGLGTPHFMAPEQFRNAKKADVRCDIYSLAATLYMMVTGELPFRSLNPLDAWMKKVNNDLPPPRAVNPEISERIDWAIRRSMSADPNLRAASCREFVDDLTGQSLPTASFDACAEETADWWYVVYQDAVGVAHTVKVTREEIQSSLNENILGDAVDIRVAKSKQGPFLPIRLHPEFRDLVAGPSVAERPSETPLDSLDKTLPQISTPGSQPTSRRPTTSGTSLSSTNRSGSIKSLAEAPKPTPATTGPVLLDIPEDEPYEEPSSEWGKSLLFIAAGMALGIVAYALAFRLFGVRWF